MKTKTEDQMIRDARALASLIALDTAKIALNTSKAALKAARDAVKVEREAAKRAVIAVAWDVLDVRRLAKIVREDQKALRAQKLAERRIAKIVREDQKALRAQKLAERQAERIVKAEARLEALKMKQSIRVSKAARKSTKGVTWSAEQVSAMNAERGLV